MLLANLPSRTTRLRSPLLLLLSTAPCVSTSVKAPPCARSDVDFPSASLLPNICLHSFLQSPINTAYVFPAFSYSTVLGGFARIYSGRCLIHLRDSTGPQNILTCCPSDTSSDYQSHPVRALIFILQGHATLDWFISFYHRTISSLLPWNILCARVVPTNEPSL
ncbi:hypothetical protein B0H10DRAFT_691559 [Mycena sp. CBHHK59/15]|nr:hypothetical protein B0H10DRAFT_691559 [Mycena sp. CBHHK59/15]